MPAREQPLRGAKAPGSYVRFHQNGGMPEKNESERRWPPSLARPRHAIREFIERYSLETRLAFNNQVVADSRTRSSWAQSRAITIRILAPPDARKRWHIFPYFAD